MSNPLDTNEYTLGLALLSLDLSQINSKIHTKKLLVAMADRDNIAGGGQWQANYCGEVLNIDKDLDELYNRVENRIADLISQIDEYE